MKQGEHPKMPYPQCIKTYYQTTMMPKVPQSMGFCGQTPKYLHCARIARALRLRRPLTGGRGTHLAKLGQGRIVPTATITDSEMW